MPNPHGREPMRRVEVKIIYDYECVRVSEKKVLYMSRICRPTLLACTHFQKTLELRRKSFGELGNTMCGAKTIRGHRLVCLCKNLQRKVSIGKSKTREP
jgi:hypothetical protein